MFWNHQPSNYQQTAITDFIGIGIEHLKGKVLAKTGAEGVYCAAYPELGLGLALKCNDGHARAAEAVTGAVTDRLGLLDDTGRELLRTESLRKLNGIETGLIRVVFPDS